MYKYMWPGLWSYALCLASTRGALNEDEGPPIETCGERLVLRRVIVVIQVLKKPTRDL
jgi:hypothetical protein